MSISIILSTGQCQGQVTEVTKGHQIQKFFPGQAAYDLYSLLHVEFKNRSHLQFNPMQVDDREGSGQPRVTQGQIFEMASSNKRVRVSEPVLSQDFKNVIFYFCTTSRNAQNRS